MIPPNAAAPKNITFSDARVEEKLRNQLVYQACVSKKEMEQQKYFMGNRLVVKFQQEVIGEGQIILIQKVTYPELTQYDAVVGGYEKLDDLLGDVKARVGIEKTPEKTEFFKILYRWL